MNILWLSHNVPYPPIGGVLQRNYHLLRAVSRRHNVFLIALNQRALLPTERELQEARAALEDCCAEVQIGALPADASQFAWCKVVFKSVFTRKPYNTNWLRSAQMRQMIRETTERVKFDLLHYDTVGLVEYFNHAPGVPRVLNHHNIESLMMWRRAKQTKNLPERAYFSLEAWKLECSERRHGLLVAANVTVSQLDAERLQAIVPGARISVCENGTDTSYFVPGSEVASGGLHLLFVGGMRWYPNRDAVLYFCREVWPRLSAVVPNARFTVVGAQPPKALKELAARDDRVTIAGYVDDVRPYFRTAGVFVVPIRDGGGTKLKVLDAMAMGKPIVATTVACEGLDVVPGRHVLIADRPEQYVEALRQLASNPALCANLATNARSLAEERYSWDRIGERLIRIHEEAAASRLSTSTPR